MTSANKFNNYIHNLSLKNINQATEVWKVMLTNTSPVATNTTYSDISATELANGNGYVTGGAVVPGTNSTNSLGVETVAGSAITWTSNTGNMGPFRYAVLVASTSGFLCEWWDYGSSITLNGANGDQFVWTPTGSALSIWQ